MVQVFRSKVTKARPRDDQLGFGQHFTDHMFVARYEEASGWDSGQIVPYGPLAVDPAASVLHYGQALFEGIKAFRQKDGTVALFRPHFNAERMRMGADRLCLPPVDATTFIEVIIALLKEDIEWMPRLRGTSMYIRPTLIGTEAFLGVRPSAQATFFVILSPVGPYYKTSSVSIPIWIEKDDLRAAPGGLGHTKAGANYAASLRAALRAKDHGCTQVLWTDHSHEFVEEVGTMNVFFRIKDSVLTPALNGSILGGGTRACCIELLQEKGIPVEERPISLAEIGKAWKSGELQEVFGTGTAAVITPVDTLVNDREVWTIDKGFGPIAKYLYDEITGIQSGEKVDRHNWLLKC